MSRSLNKAVLIGHVGADPEVRTTAGGTRVATFSLATSRRWTTRDGREHEKTEWHRVVAWGRLAGDVERFVRKGDRVYAEGRLEYRTWEDASGRTRYATEIVAQELIPLDSAADRSPGRGVGRGAVPAAQPEDSGSAWSSSMADAGSGEPPIVEEDDLPF
jgi:single-strand DNA-binding protein